MSKFVIGITGYKGSGKNALATALSNSEDCKGIFSYAAEFQFASPLYAMMDALLPFFGVDPKKEPTTRENKEAPINPAICGDNVSRRTLLQTLGTEWGRVTINPELWLNIMQRRINECRSDLCIITDVRFNNEAAFIRKNGGMIISVHRAGQKGDAHASESGIDGQYIDLTVFNDGTTADLEKIAKRIWQLATLFVSASPQQRARVFPVSLWAKSGDEAADNPAPKGAAVQELPDLDRNHEVVKQVLQTIQALGVVISHDRMLDVALQLRKQGLMP